MLIHLFELRQELALCSLVDRLKKPSNPENVPDANWQRILENRKTWLKQIAEQARKQYPVVISEADQQKIATWFAQEEPQLQSELRYLYTAALNLISDVHHFTSPFTYQHKAKKLLSAAAQEELIPELTQLQTTIGHYFLNLKDASPKSLVNHLSEQLDWLNWPIELDGKTFAALPERLARTSEWELLCADYLKLIQTSPSTLSLKEAKTTYTQLQILISKRSEYLKYTDLAQKKERLTSKGLIHPTQVLDNLKQAYTTYSINVDDFKNLTLPYQKAFEEYTSASGSPEEERIKEQQLLNVYIEFQIQLNAKLREQRQDSISSDGFSHIKVRGDGSSLFKAFTNSVSLCANFSYSPTNDNEQLIIDAMLDKPTAKKYSEGFFRDIVRMGIGEKSIFIIKKPNIVINLEELFNRAYHSEDFKQLYRGKNLPLSLGDVTDATKTDFLCSEVLKQITTDKYRQRNITFTCSQSFDACILTTLLTIFTLRGINFVTKSDDYHYTKRFEEFEDYDEVTLLLSTMALVPIIGNPSLFQGILREDGPVLKPELTPALFIKVKYKIWKPTAKNPSPKLDDFEADIVTTKLPGGYALQIVPGWVDNPSYITSGGCDLLLPYRRDLCTFLDVPHSRIIAGNAGNIDDNAPSRSGVLNWFAESPLYGRDEDITTVETLLHQKVYSGASHWAELARELVELSQTKLRSLLPDDQQTRKRYQTLAQIGYGLWLDVILYDLNDAKNANDEKKIDSLKKMAHEVLVHASKAYLLGHIANDSNLVLKLNHVLDELPVPSVDEKEKAHINELLNSIHVISLSKEEESVLIDVVLTQMDDDFIEKHRAIIHDIGFNIDKNMARRFYRVAQRAAKQRSFEETRKFATDLLDECNKQIASLPEHVRNDVKTQTHLATIEQISYGMQLEVLLEKLKQAVQYKEIKNHEFNVDIAIKELIGTNHTTGHQIALEMQAVLRAAFNLVARSNQPVDSRLQQLMKAMKGVLSYAVTEQKQSIESFSNLVIDKMQHNALKSETNHLLSGNDPLLALANTKASTRGTAASNSAAVAARAEALPPSSSSNNLKPPVSPANKTPATSLPVIIEPAASDRLPIARDQILIRRMELLPATIVNDRGQLKLRDDYLLTNSIEKIVSDVEIDPVFMLPEMTEQLERYTSITELDTHEKQDKFTIKYFAALAAYISCANNVDLANELISLKQFLLEHLPKIASELEVEQATNLRTLISKLCGNSDALDLTISDIQEIAKINSKFTSNAKPLALAAYTAIVKNALEKARSELKNYKTDLLERCLKLLTDNINSLPFVELFKNAPDHNSHYDLLADMIDSATALLEHKKDTTTFVDMQRVIAIYQKVNSVKGNNLKLYSPDLITKKNKLYTAMGEYVEHHLSNENHNSLNSTTCETIKLVVNLEPRKFVTSKNISFIRLLNVYSRNESVPHSDDIVPVVAPANHSASSVESAPAHASSSMVVAAAANPAAPGVSNTTRSVLISKQDIKSQAKLIDIALNTILDRKPGQACRTEMLDLLNRKDPGGDEQGIAATIVQMRLGNNPKGYDYVEKLLSTPAIVARLSAKEIADLLRPHPKLIKKVIKGGGLIGNLFESYAFNPVRRKLGAAEISSLLESRFKTEILNSNSNAEDISTFQLARDYIIQPSIWQRFVNLFGVGIHTKFSENNNAARESLVHMFDKIVNPFITKLDRPSEPVSLESLTSILDAKPASPVQQQPIAATPPTTSRILATDDPAKLATKVRSASPVPVDALDTILDAEPASLIQEGSIEKPIVGISPASPPPISEPVSTEGSSNARTMEVSEPPVLGSTSTIANALGRPELQLAHSKTPSLSGSDDEAGPSVQKGVVGKKNSRDASPVLTPSASSGSGSSTPRSVTEEEIEEIGKQLEQNLVGDHLPTPGISPLSKVDNNRDILPISEEVPGAQPISTP